jgi:hypothetical protein
MPSSRNWRSMIWIVSVAAGLAQTIAYRHQMTPDGIAYLDIARNCEQGHWHALVNAYWSPLYPLLLGMFFRVFRPSPYWESTFAHFIGFGIFLGSFAAFEFMLHEFVRVRHFSNGRSGDLQPLPEWSMWAIGDALFVYLTLLLIQLGRLQPDLCVAALVYLAAGLVLRISAGEKKWTLYAVLGAVLGIGYLTKAIMFPVGCLFLVWLFLPKPRSSSWPRAAVAVLAFAVISAPYVGALSVEKRRVTYGDVGKIAYAEFVDGIPRFIHWQGAPDVAGKPLHPTRMVLSSPPVFEFASPVGGTYPPWYDSSYWYDGVSPKFIWRGQLQAVRYTIEEYASILTYMAALLTGFVGMLLFAQASRSIRRSLLQSSPIWGPALVALGIYSLVYVESRFVVPFFVLIWVSLFGALWFREEAASSNLVRSMVLAIVLTLGSGVVWVGGRSLFRALQPQPFTDWQVAQALRTDGVLPGDHVASVGNALWGYWAHLASVKVVAEVPDWGTPELWAAPKATQDEVFAAFARAGAKVVVSDQPPRGSLAETWQKLGSTNYYIRALNFPVAFESAGR